jgi:putative transposase
MPFANNLPRRRSVRLKDYDYTQAGIYFVTICTHDRRLYFDDQSLREVAAGRWQAIPEHTPSVRLDEWVIMPNHLHGLIVFEQEPELDTRGTLQPGARMEFGQMSSISPARRSLAAVVRAYKAAVTGVCRKAGQAFAWQAGYHEHVVRGDNDLDNIRKYISDNPLKWELDSEHPNNRSR